MSSASHANPSPHPKLWEQKNVWIAGILAYLIPGAGHVYQGRTVKGLIYCLSILGLFIWGQKLGEGMVVYTRPDFGNRGRTIALSYVAQLGVGGIALPAVLQTERAIQPANHPLTRLTTPFKSSFEGTLHPASEANPGHLVGTLQLDPVEGQFGPEVKGTFTGTLDGKPTELNLGGGRFELDRPIKAGFRRRLDCGVVDEAGSPRWIVGSVPRSFVNSYGAPPDAIQLQDLNDRLGKIYELALVFTWIAGLLNVLAVWDCVNGPAYGFGDEHALASEESRQAKTTNPAAATPTSPDEPRVENRSGKVVSG